MKKYLDPKYTPVTALSGNPNSARAGGNGHGKVKPAKAKPKAGAAKKK